MDKDKCGHIYLVHKREFKATNTPIYKIGRSQTIHQRLSHYSKCTIIQVWYVDDIFSAEADIIKSIGATFQSRKDIGSEYFEGDKYKIVNVIDNIIIKYRHVGHNDETERLAHAEERQRILELEAEIIQECLESFENRTNGAVALRDFYKHFKTEVKLYYPGYRHYGGYQGLLSKLNKHCELSIYMDDNMEMITIPKESQYTSNDL